jgi:hypothetical protein
MTTTGPPVSRGELDDEEEPSVEAQRFSPEEEAVRNLAACPSSLILINISGY